MIPRSSENPLQSDINREITRCGDLWLSEWKKNSDHKTKYGKEFDAFNNWVKLRLQMATDCTCSYTI